MKSIESTAAIYIWQGSIDMRMGYYRLSSFVSEHISKSVINGGVYLFFSRCRSRVKLLYWDRDGYALWTKKLEAGKYRIEKTDEYEIISATELDFLLSGTDFSRIKLAKNAEKSSYAESNYGI